MSIDVHKWWRRRWPRPRLAEPVRGHGYERSKQALRSAKQPGTSRSRGRQTVGNQQCGKDGPFNVHEEPRWRFWGSHGPGKQIHVRSVMTDFTVQLLKLRHGSRDTI